VHRGAIAFAALTVLAVAPSLLALAIALAIPPLIALLVSAAIASRITREGPRFVLTRHTFVSQVAPLGAGVLLSALYFRIDVYFLERYYDLSVVGYYNAAYRLVDAVRLFPAAGLAVAYPALCAATSLAALKRISLILAAGAMLIASSIYATAPALLVFVYGAAFGTAASALQALALSIPFFFVNYALTYQLIAWDRQNAYLAVAATALMVNVVANVLLIPGREMIGAAYSTLITEMVVCAGCVVSLRRR
jgi:O-antigen/teichoic acid export membrane protein